MITQIDHVHLSLQKTFFHHFLFDLGEEDAGFAAGDDDPINLFFFDPFLDPRQARGGAGKGKNLHMSDLRIFP